MAAPSSKPNEEEEDEFTIHFDEVGTRFKMPDKIRDYSWEIKRDSSTNTEVSDQMACAAGPYNEIAWKNIRDQVTLMVRMWPNGKMERFIEEWQSHGRPYGETDNMDDDGLHFTVLKDNRAKVDGRIAEWRLLKAGKVLYCLFFAYNMKRVKPEDAEKVFQEFLGNIKWGDEIRNPPPEPQPRKERGSSFNPMTAAVMGGVLVVLLSIFIFTRK